LIRQGYKLRKGPCWKKKSDPRLQ